MKIIVLKNNEAYKEKITKKLKELDSSINNIKDIRKEGEFTDGSIMYTCNASNGKSYYIKVLPRDISENNERSYNPLSDINHLIGKEYSNIHRLGRDLDSLGYDLIYHNDDYVHITDAMESDDMRYIYRINHNKNGSISIGKFVKEEEL